MRVNGIPGFEFTGEFREPVTGDFYWNGYAVEQRGPGDWLFKQPRLILRRLRSTDLGDYELTGAFRAAGIDEPYLGWEVADLDRSVVRFGPTASGSAIHILREKRA